MNTPRCGVHINTPCGCGVTVRNGEAMTKDRADFVAFFGDGALLRKAKELLAPTKPKGKRGPALQNVDLLDAIAAMQVGDPPLRWKLPLERRHSIQTRIGQSMPGKFWTHHYGGEIWIVRYA